MKMSFMLRIIFTWAICLLSCLPLCAQTVKKWTLAEIMAMAKPGQWVDIDGLIQKDQSLFAFEIEFLAGDFMDDDWELKAKVRAVSPDKNELQVLSVPVRVTKDTEFDDENGFKNLGEIKPEMLVKVQGTYLKDGVFLAREIDDRNNRLKENPDLNNMIELVGKIAQVDATKHMITVMGMSFYITEETDGKSLIK